MSDAGRSPQRRRKSRRRQTSLAGRIGHSAAVERAVGLLVSFGIASVQSLGSERALRWARRLVKLVAPFFPETRTAAASIAAAFPEKSPAERKAILDGAWESFARVMVEFIFLEELAGRFDPALPDKGYVTVAGLDDFLRIRDDGKPGIVVTAHLANWEMLSVVAEKFGLKTVIPFRRPTNPYVADAILSRREPLMGKLVDNSRGATFELAAVLDAGGHLGMLVDQQLWRGIEVPFFGRPALTNPLVARFARQYECPVYAARSIRRPDGGLHLELTGPLELPRDSEGLIDVYGAMATINNLVEKWVREHPEQWFWLHDRWKR